MKNILLSKVLLGVMDLNHFLHNVITSPLNQKNYQMEEIKKQNKKLLKKMSHLFMLKKYIPNIILRGGNKKCL